MKRSSKPNGRLNQSQNQPQSTSLAAQHGAEEILTEQQVADRLMVKPKLCRQWRKRRGMPHFRLGSKVIRYRWADVSCWLNDQCF